ncbi:MAG: ABC transporter ATP-binding protein [Spirochaetes bacterium]|nr:ABC transporter ATP-binding protein [Spirochaetota bacterium]
MPFKKVFNIYRSVVRAAKLVFDASPSLSLLALAANIVIGLVPLVTVYSTKLFIDHIILLVNTPSGGLASIAQLWPYLGVLCAAWFTGRWLDAANNLLTGLIRSRVDMHCNVLIMRKCASFDIAFFENPDHFDVLQNAQRGASQSAWSMLQYLISMVRQSLTLASFLFVLFKLHWLVVLLVFAVTLPQSFLGGFFARVRWQMQKDRTPDERLRWYFSYLLTDRSVIKEIRTFGLAELFLGKYQEYATRFWKQEMGMSVRERLVDSAFTLIEVAGSALVWAYIAARVISHTLTIGDIVLFTSAVESCRGNARGIFTSAGNLYGQSLFLDNLYTLLEISNEKIDGALRSPHKKTRHVKPVPVPQTLTKGIEFRNVSFRYPASERWVVEGLNFKLLPGQSTALVGKNGAGKTSLVKLLSRLYDPTSGTILLEGRDLREYDLAGVRRFFSVVFQDFVRYSLTLKENIVFGDLPHAEDRERMERAAANAGINTIIKRLPHGYDSWLGRLFGTMKSGADLSGGEWQKVALARGYMSESPALVLDEPTASLDVFAEAEIFNGLAKVAEGRLTVIVSHRFSTVRSVDNILVFDEGHLAEQGNHRTLMKRRGLYASMFNAQASQYR